MRMTVVGAWILAGIMAISAYGLEPDDRNDRLHVRSGHLYEDDSREGLNAILLPDLCRADLTEGDVVEAIASISEVGATALGFDLSGFSSDGKTLNAGNLEAFQLLKDEADYRWTSLLCRVLGDFDNPSHEARLNAVKTAAETLHDSTRVLYWIDGKRSGELAAAFKKIAPSLTVASAQNGDVDAVLFEHSIIPQRPALVVGHLPEHTSSHVLSVVEGTPENFAAYDRQNAAALELEEGWLPGTEGLSQEEIDEGFYTLFYRSDMSNWTITGAQSGFAEHYGGISWIHRGGHRVVTRKRYDNFVLRLEWRVYHHGANSGLFIRAPRTNRESALGMEIQIFGDPGEEPNENSSGAVYDVLPALSNPSNPIGQWNDYEVRANGPHLTVKMNGVVVQDVNLDEDEKLRHRLRNGFIKLQDHGDRVTFRHIRIKEL